jgi:hypothetical protein
MSSPTIPFGSSTPSARSRGGRVQTRHAEGDGRPGYAPGDLLKLYIYGYLNRVRSSRRRAVFRQFTLLCRELNLFGRELLAVDGTRIKAVNNKDATLRRTRWRSSSRRWTSVWTNICGGSTRAMPKKPRPMARAPKTSRKD